MTIKDPFASAEDLAPWAAEVLQTRGIDAIVDWRMLEYWVQVELYRAVQLNQAGAWRHLGDYEQPCVTQIPRAKSETKWVDLILARERDGRVERVVWVELKDLGRNPQTAGINALGLGKDLAALWGIDKAATIEQWRKPPARAVDRGRLHHWIEHSKSTADADWWIGQVVIVPKRRFESVTEQNIKEPWLKEFEARVTRKRGAAPSRPVIARAMTDEFRVYAVVARAPTT
jgi:hypothetical protein